MDKADRDIIKQKFAKLRRLHLFSVVAVVLGVLIMLISQTVFSSSLLRMRVNWCFISGAILGFGGIVFNIFFWRCPACKQNMENKYNPKKCPWCKAVLR